MLNPCARQAATAGVVRYGFSVRAALVFLVVILLLTGLPHRGTAYEWIDQIQDKTSLRVPTEILLHPLSDLPEKDSQGTLGRLETDWFLRKRAIAVGDRKAGAVLLERLKDEKIDAGVVRLPAYSASLLREAVALSKMGEYEEAVARCQAALYFSPGLSEPHRVLARVYWRQDKLNIFKAAFEWGKAAWTIPRSFEHIVLSLTNLNLLLLAISSLFFAVFYLVQLLRYYGLLQHDLQEVLPGKTPRPWVQGITVLCLLLPLLLGRGIYAMCLFWVLVFWSYSGRKERIVHLLFLLFTALVPFWIHSLQGGMETLYGEEMQAVLGHQEGRSDDATVAELVRLTARHPGNDTYFFMLGTAEKKRGEYKKAEDAFLKAISINPSEAIYYNNLGNAYYASRDFSNAIRMYEKGIPLDPKLASLHFNLSATQREQFQLNKSDQEYFKARALDPELISYYVDIIGPNYNRMVIDETLSRKWTWNRFAKGFFSREGKGGETASLFWEASRYWAVPLILLLAVFPVHFVRSRFGVAHRCMKCGVVYCRKCQTHMRSDAVCSQCAYIFEEHSGVDVKQRTKKIIEIRRHMERSKEVARLLGILIPGSGHIFSGRVLTGFVILFIVAASLVYALFGPILYPDPMVARASLWDGRFLVLVPAGLVYAGSVHHVYRLRG